MSFEEWERTFTFTQRLVISAALDGLTMQEIATQKNMKLDSVRQAWKRIVEKIGAAVDDDHNRLREFHDLSLRPIFAKHCKKEDPTVAYVNAVADQLDEDPAFHESAGHLRKAAEYLKRGQEKETK